MADSEEYPLEISIFDCMSPHPCTELEDDFSKAEMNALNITQETLSNKSSLSLFLYKDDMQKIKDFDQPKPELLLKKQILLGLQTKKYTLFLDLDHTLVYSEVERNSTKTDGQYFLKINLRPFAQELINEMADLYEICIFTAASEEYAKEVVSLLDPEGKIKKIISRKNCVELKEGYVVKDLRIFGDRDLKNVLIVDDSIYSYAFQIGNGIPVGVFEGDEGDQELILLNKYLKGLCEQNPENIAELNKNRLWVGLC